MQTQPYKSETIRLPQGIEAIRTGLSFLDRVSPAVADNILLNLFLRVRHSQPTYLSALPFAAQQITIYHNLRKLVGFEWYNDGPTVMLVHGWESNLGQMLSFVEPLRRNGFRVIAFDQPGHGLSPSQPAHLIDMADAVHDVVMQHGPVHGIIAHSMGAAATLLSLSRYSTHVNRLALVAPMPDLDTHLHHFSEAAALSGAMRARLRKQVESRLAVTIDACNAAYAAETIQTNALVVHDCRDQIIPVEAGFEIAKQLNAALITTDGLGHRGILDDRITAGRIADFMC